MRTVYEELCYLRNTLQNQSSLLLAEANKFERNLKENEPHNKLTLKIVQQEFKKIREIIIHNNLEAENVNRNYFLILPPDVLSLLVFYLPSFTELGKLASVSKNFHNLITSNQDKYLEYFCVDWWNNYLGKKHLNSLSISLQWIQRSALDYNPLFSWKWFGHCIRRYNDQAWTVENQVLYLGKIGDGKLEGMGIHMRSSTVIIGHHEQGLIDGPGVELNDHYNYIYVVDICVQTLLTIFREIFQEDTMME